MISVANDNPGINMERKNRKSCPSPKRAAIMTEWRRNFGTTESNIKTLPRRSWATSESAWAGLLDGSGLEVACTANFRVADNSLGLLLRNGPRPGEFRLTSPSRS